MGEREKKMKKERKQEISRERKKQVVKCQQGIGGHDWLAQVYHATNVTKIMFTKSNMKVRLTWED